jgi:hypothetical protein
MRIVRLREDVVGNGSDGQHGRVSKHSAVEASPTEAPVRLGQRGGARRLGRFAFVSAGNR